jgi:acetyl-CoA carboxylase biotin carboxylase subunit
MMAQRPRSLRKILVANRGEIAVRVIRACREMGIATVAVASDADTGALHAELADECVVLGPPEPAASYLDMDKVLDAARSCGADAVHPGYGFLAENAGFARRCAEAGLVFIGPSPEVIATMGEKTAARAAMEAAGVPVVPGAALPEPDDKGVFPAAAVDEAVARLGCPVMVKAAFGGGGKGMRLVREPAQVQAACQAAAREALGAFGDGKIYLEKFIERPRHVEFQVFGDAAGRAVHLFERECSVQRRHQKIIEETPSPFLTPDLRQRMGEAAVRAVRAVNYVNAGTVEFLLGPDGSYYFLEMNTRLQVEHPVTELVTGTDLVRAQIEVAAGAPLPWRQEDLVARGHAIECRVYAEDPEQGFMPSLGRLVDLVEPVGPGVRIDTGVRPGDEISLHYDPLIAKLSVHAGDRGAAIERALAALRDYAVLGVTTNIEYLQAILADEAFGAGDLHTGFLEERLDGWRSGRGEDTLLAVVAAAVAEMDGTGAAAASGDTDQTTGPWENLGHFRLRGLDGSA